MVNFAETGQKNIKQSICITILMTVVLNLLFIILLGLGFKLITGNETEEIIGIIYASTAIILFVLTNIFSINTAIRLRLIEKCVNIIRNDNSIKDNIEFSKLSDDIIIEIYFIILNNFRNKLKQILDIMVEKKLINKDDNIIFKNETAELVDISSRRKLLISSKFIYLTYEVQHIKGKVIRFREMTDISVCNVINFDQLRRMNVVRITYEQHNKSKRINIFSENNEILLITLKNLKDNK
jgi:hypothetical protein